MVTKRHLFVAVIACLLIVGCGSNPTAPPPPSERRLGYPFNDTPRLTVDRLVRAYEGKYGTDYQELFTRDFAYEFSTSTDPTLVQQYSTGWFKNDEKEAAQHSFNGYAVPGGEKLPAATSIDINLAVDTPTDDNTSGTDPRTHKVLATRLDGTVTVPGNPDPLTYAMVNNYNVFYLVRGDVAVNLDSTQPADSTHWYVYRWVDLSEGPTLSPARGPVPAKPATWGFLKAEYR